MHNMDRSKISSVSNIVINATFDSRYLGQIRTLVKTDNFKRKLFTTSLLS